MPPLQVVHIVLVGLEIIGLEDNVLIEGDGSCLEGFEHGFAQDDFFFECGC